MKRDISNRITTQPRLTTILVLLALVAILGACDIFGAPAPTPTPAPVLTLPPRATPTPTSTPTPLPTPTPTPIRNLTSSQVEQLVFLKVSPCADQVSLLSETPVQMVITSIYSAEEGWWISEATSKDATLSFGQWQVLDATGEVTPLDTAASAIALPGTSCAERVAPLAKGPVPPLFLTPIPTPTPTSTPIPTLAPVVTTGTEAELRVWVNVYGCYAAFPELSSFIAYQYGPERWVVEGKSENTQYGLWQVDGITGEIAPLDQLAESAATICGLRAEAAFPPAFTGEQAELGVWAAVYDCFTPKPERTSFTSYVDNPQRWLVEGRGEETVEVQVERVVGDSTETFMEKRTETVFYGFWVVHTTTATITPWDQLARETEARECFQTS